MLVLHFLLLLLGQVVVVSVTSVLLLLLLEAAGTALGQDALYNLAYLKEENTYTTWYYVLFYTYVYVRSIGQIILLTLALAKQWQMNTSPPRIPLTKV